MSRKSKKNRPDEDGFEAWGGYMAAKQAKLHEQFTEEAAIHTEQMSCVLRGVSILVNGYTKPSAEELKELMAVHGGRFQLYQDAGTTHIIASNLPNVKIKQLGNIPIVKPEWVTDSITAGKLLDYKKYLLYTNMDRRQPLLNFPVAAKPEVLSEPKPSTSRTLTAADPKFLAEFYNNSRLHLISTLGAEFKQLVCQLRDKSDGKFPGRERLDLLSGTNVAEGSPVIMHIDMDCFFVSVGLRSRPELRGKPVAVTHARGTHDVSRSEESAAIETALYQKHFPEAGFEKVNARASMSEIASCSYEARKCGVKNGMFLGSALKLCPDLQPIPYDFQGYREVSNILYNTIAAYTLDIEAVSCDEMYVDVGPLLQTASITVEQWATHIRKEIMDATGCPCSTGFGANRLQARLATKKAKPAGQFHLKPQNVESYMFEIPLAELPGVGHATATKLSGLGLKTCGDVHGVTLARLQAELGQKVGETIFEQARGADSKPLNFYHERKSVSADVNYGIRFKDKTEAVNFLRSLSAEVSSRLQDIGMRARCLTLKLLVRAPDAPKETAKFLGCGVCNAVNRSTTSGSLMSNPETVFREANALFEKVDVPPDELRGVGIQLTKLEKLPSTSSTLSRFFRKNDKKRDANDLNSNETSTSAQATNETTTTTTATASNKSVTSNSGISEAKAPHRLQSKETHPKPSKKASPKKEPRTKGKRGRPKGSCNKLTRKKSNDLDRYFKPKVTKITTEDIDVKVFNELPLDLRFELMKEYGLSDKVLEEPVNSCVEEPLPTASAKSEFDSLGYEELKQVILNWLKSDSEPSQIDVKMIAEHFKQLALNRRIENLRWLLNFLYRHVAKRNLCTWHEAYWTIISTVQEGMVVRYNGTLLVETGFSCSKHS